MMNTFPAHTQGSQTPFRTGLDYNQDRGHRTWAQIHERVPDVQTYLEYQHFQYGIQGQYPAPSVPSHLSFPMSVPATAHHPDTFNMMQNVNMTDPAVLGQSVTFPFSEKVAKNSVLKSAMSERLATFSPGDPKERGQPTEELIRLYETWATGGIGIIITGNIQIKKDHLEATGNAIIDKDLPSDYLEYYRTLARAAKTCGSLVLGQLSHPGRQASLTIQSYPESASDIEHPSMAGVLFARPTPLTKEGIRDVVQRFAYAASVLHAARFDGIQLHAAHGYLLHQFLSLRTNKRTDEYGGVLLSNRARLLLEIIAEIRRAVNDPTFMVSVKLNCRDLLYPHDVSEEESIALVKMLESAGVDLVEVSGGTYETPQSSEHDRNSHSQRSSQEAYFIDFANRLRPHLFHTKICVTGGFRSASAMADAIRSGLTDVVGLARPLAAEPFLVAEMLNGTKSRAKEDKLPPSQILRIAAAAAQIAEIGNGYDITDFNSAFNVSRFVARLQKEIPTAMSEAFASGPAMSF